MSTQDAPYRTPEFESKFLTEEAAGDPELASLIAHREGVLDTMIETHSTDDEASRQELRLAMVAVEHRKYELEHAHSK